MSKIEYVATVPAVVVRTTAKAALLLFEDGSGLEAWVPFSQCSEGTCAELAEGNCIERPRVRAWIADEKDLPLA